MKPTPIFPQLLDPESLNSLPENEFSNVLKHATRDGNIDPLGEVAIARLQANQLTVQDLYMLLIPSGDRYILIKTLAIL